MLSIFFIIISYILGSIPFGFIFSKISGKNILKIGWRKTSGSNVFRNVGIWQGVATGLCDMGKGFLAVFLAEKFGLSLQVQAFCGVAAVVGHNWSLFIKFAGGRGIGTFMGAFLALNLKILFFSIIPFALLALIWNASIGTILFLLTALFLSLYFNYSTIAFNFVLLSFLPIFIKRLSPVKELSFKKPEIIRNRLILDDDISNFGFRIIKIINRLTKK